MKEIYLIECVPCNPFDSFVLYEQGFFTDYSDAASRISQLVVSEMDKVTKGIRIVPDCFRVFTVRSLPFSLIS